MTEETKNQEPQPKMFKTSCFKRVVSAACAGASVGIVSGLMVGATVVVSRALTGQIRG